MLLSIVFATILLVIGTNAEQDYFKLGFDVYEASGNSQKLVRRKDQNGHYQPFLLKRDGSNSNLTEISLENNSTLSYMVNITLGSNKSPLAVQLDTGSSDLWVYGSLNNICTGSCASEYGTYDAEGSETANYTGHLFSISYVDGTSASGGIYEDELVVGDYNINNFTFGVVSNEYITNPVFGIGLESTESFPYVYSNFPSRLYDDGFIKSMVYSVYLDDINATSGNFLAGAVDKNQFNGDLTLCPLVTLGQLFYSYFYITSNGINITNSAGGAYTIAGAKHPIIMDSGSTILYIPQIVYENLGLSFPGISLFNSIGYVAKCSVLEKYTFDIDLCGTTFKIPLRDISYSIPDAIKVGLLEVSDNKLDKGEYCSLQIELLGDNSILAGDLLMRNLYVYYDLENFQLGVGEANYDNNGENIVTITNTTDISGFAVKGSKYSETYVGPSDSALPSDGVDTTLSGVQATGFNGLKNSGMNQQSNLNVYLLGASAVAICLVNGLLVPFF